MLYPVQTSFIPVTVALVQFIETHGFGGLYPYWYLGTTPVKYLTGPVVPGVLVGLHKLLADFSLFDLSLLLVVSGQLLFSSGWGVFAAKLWGDRKVGWWVGILSLVLPWHWVSSLGLAEVSAVLASALTPWVLLAFSVQRSASSEGERKLYAIRYTLVPTLFFALLLLTNTTASIQAIVGLLILGIIATKHWNQGLKKVFIVVAAGWLLTLWWYGPGFWWTTLLAPSIGGRSAVIAFVSLLNLLRGFVPVILAVILVWWKIRPKNIFEKFTLIWLTTFGSLTLFRFIADPDFWLDWTSWVGEVEVGLALLFAPVLSSLTAIKKRSTNLDDKFEVISPSRSSLRQHRFSEEDSQGFGSWLRHVFDWRQAYRAGIIFLILLLISWILAFANRDFWLPRKDISQSVEYRIAEFLGDNVGADETVFLSGTTAFWLNSLVDVRQVRGGRDEASVDPSTGLRLRGRSDSRSSGWREAAWEIRSGLDPKKSERLVRELGIDYLVIHTNKSSEYYHDFEDPGKFEKIDSLVKVYEEDGDIVWKLLSFRIGNDN